MFESTTFKIRTNARLLSDLGHAKVGKTCRKASTCWVRLVMSRTLYGNVFSLIICIWTSCGKLKKLFNFAGLISPEEVAVIKPGKKTVANRTNLDNPLIGLDWIGLDWIGLDWIGLT